MVRVSCDAATAGHGGERRNRLRRADVVLHILFPGCKKLHPTYHKRLIL